MLAAGIASLILGYALLYSGVSQIATGGNGWGIIQSLTGKGTSTGGQGSVTNSLFNAIQPQGNSGAATPAPAQSPVSGVTRA